MFRFEHPDFLWALSLLPVLIAYFAISYARRKRALERFANPELLDRLAPGWNPRRHVTKFVLICLALPLLVIAWANPQFSAQRETVTRRGIDLVVALDVSRSMLAQDVQPSRLERSRRFATQLIDQLASNNIGLELFTCTAFMRVPRTTDYAMVKSVISMAGPGMMETQGTDLGEAIKTGEQAFDEQNPNHRALIIISDGEDHGGKGAEAAAEARKNGLLIYTVGVGRAEGTFIPIMKDLNREDYARNSQGEPIRTKANVESLQAIAAAGGGDYYNLTSDSGALADRIRAKIDEIEKLEFESYAFKSYDSYFAYFMWPGVLLLLIEFMINYRGQGE